MKKSTSSRDRDKGRKYKSGAQKRKVKSNTEKKISELSKITSFLNIIGDVDVDTIVHTSDELPCSSFTSTDTTSIYPQVNISRANSEETAVVEKPCDSGLWQSNMNDRSTGMLILILKCQR